MCSGSEAGSYLRLIDFVYHSTLGLRVIKKKKKVKGWGFREDSPAHPYRGISLIRNSAPLGPYSRTMPRALWKLGGGAVSYERGTPAPDRLCLGLRVWVD